MMLTLEFGKEFVALNSAMQSETLAESQADVSSNELQLHFKKLITFLLFFVYLHPQTEGDSLLPV